MTFLPLSLLCGSQLSAGAVLLCVSFLRAVRGFFAADDIPGATSLLVFMLLFSVTVFLILLLQNFCYFLLFATC